MCVHEFSCSCIDETVRVLFVNMSTWFVGLYDELVELVTDDDLAIWTQGDVISTEIVGNGEPFVYLNWHGQRSKDSFQKKLKELDDLLCASSLYIALDAIYKYIDAAVKLLKALGATPQSFPLVVLNAVPQRVTPKQPAARSSRVPLGLPEMRKSSLCTSLRSRTLWSLQVINSHIPGRLFLYLIAWMSRKQIEQLGYFVNADCIGRVKDGAN